MRRIRGFLQIDESALVKESDYAPEQYWLKIDNEMYYFKSKSLSSSYRELVACYIAKHLGIDAVMYDLATFKRSHGAISRSYRKPNCKYIIGKDILDNYAENNKGILRLMGLDKTVIDDVELNNLEIIWEALEYKYKDNKKANIEELMRKIVLQYIFSILIMGEDKGCQNWEIEESEDKIDLVPLFDNEYSFGFEYESYYAALTTSVGEYYVTMPESIKRFLSISSQDYIDLFLEKFNILTNEKLLLIIEEIEQDIEARIPYPIKEEIIKSFNRHRSKIESVLIDLNLQGLKR